MPLTSSVMRQSISNFRLCCCSKKIQTLRLEKVKLLLEQLQVCIFAEIVFGVRCTLREGTILHKDCSSAVFNIALEKGRGKKKKKLLQHGVFEFGHSSKYRA